MAVGEKGARRLRVVVDGAAGTARSMFCAMAPLVVWRRWFVAAAGLNAEPSAVAGRVQVRSCLLRMTPGSASSPKRGPEVDHGLLRRASFFACWQNSQGSQAVAKCCPITNGGLRRGGRAMLHGMAAV